MKWPTILAGMFVAQLASAQQFTIDGKEDSKEEDEAPIILNGNSSGLNINLNEGLRGQTFALRLRIPNTPKAVKEAEFVDKDGRKIQFRMLADSVTGLIIGTPVEGLQLELLHTLNEDGTFSYVIIGRKGDIIYNLGPEDIFLTNLRFGNFCFNLERSEVSGLPINVGLAVDVSGSMGHVLPEVVQSMHSFAKTLPEKAQCQVTFFDHDSYNVAPRSAGSTQVDTSASLLPQRSCSDFENLGFLQEAAKLGGGGTNIVKALRPHFQASSGRPDTLNAVLIISDGAGQADRGSAEFRALVQDRDLAVENAGVYTVVNWLGNFSTNYPLADVADMSFPGPVGNQLVADEFFKRARALMAARVIITPKTCE